MRSRPTVVVLAAGRASRTFSRAQRLERPFGSMSVLATTLQVALASGLPVIAMATPSVEPEVRALMAARDIVVVPEAAARAGSHPVAAGIMARADASGWMLLPGDMPMVRAPTLLAVADGLAHYPVVYAQHEGRPGHPVAFGSELYSELARLDDDDATRRVIARYPSLGVDVDDPGTLISFNAEDAVRRRRAGTEAADAQESNARRA